MKKSITVLFLATALSALSFAKDPGMKVLEQKRREIKQEETTKANQEEEILKEKRRELNESLEEKVFRSKNTPEDRALAADDAFEIGKDRVAFMRMEEQQIRQLEKQAGIKPDKKHPLMAEEFDKVYNKYKKNNDKVGALIYENQRLKEYLDKLDAMEARMKQGN